MSRDQNVWWEMGMCIHVCARTVCMHMCDVCTEIWEQYQLCFLRYTA